MPDTRGLSLAYNIVVILWGVFLRASKSGDGCGQHWLTCHGEVIPSAPELKTVIEFSHRLTSGLAFIVVLILVIWAFRKFEKGHHIRKTALVSFIFIITEALVGAGLVLTGNTAETLTAARPFWMAGHLINTFILLAFLSLTAWFASGGRQFDFKAQPKVLLFLALAILGILFVGLSGSVAALSSMLFPSATLAEGVAKDFSETSHILLRLRVSHPILSILVGVFLVFLAGWLKSKAEGESCRYKALGKCFVDFGFNSVRMGRADASDACADCDAARSSGFGGRGLDCLCFDVGKFSGGKKYFR